MPVMAGAHMAACGQQNSAGGGKGQTVASESLENTVAQ